ncbi:hypothetical protein [Marinomonas gallaica]|uniref:hypothetical protein n=1 Tax=Marinomonas gallaica TaxID=1806667 RepID=UPI003A95670D
MTEQEAEELSVVLLKVVGLLDQTAAFVRDKDSTENWEKYRRAVGKAMGEIYLEMEEPLWERFPHLKPKQLGGSYEIDPQIYEPNFYVPEQ